MIVIQRPGRFPREIIFFEYRRTMVRLYGLEYSCRILVLTYLLGKSSYLRSQFAKGGQTKDVEVRDIMTLKENALYLNSIKLSIVFH